MIEPPVSKQPWIKFYPADWRADPALRTCSLGARGLWMEMLCLMHEAAPRGSLLVNGKPVSIKGLANLAGSNLKEVEGYLDELETAGVFSKDGDGLVFSRRMRRDDEKAARDKANGKQGGGNPNIRRGIVPKDERVRPFKRSDAPAKTRRIFDRDGGRCYWCDERLMFESFHIDHVTAVCDGGTNEESNLVAACPDCNGRRAVGQMPATVRHQYKSVASISVGRSPTTTTDYNHRPQPGGKAQKPEARGQRPESNPESASLTISAELARSKTADFRQEIIQQFRRLGLQQTPETGYAEIWLAKGYDPAICLAVIADGLPRKTDVRSLKYFDGAVREAHEKRSRDSVPIAPKERTFDLGGEFREIPERNIPGLIKLFSERGHWQFPSPKPGEPGCRIPDELLPEDLRQGAA